MNNKEILQELLKKALGDRLAKLEKKNNESESSLKLIKTSYDGFEKKISMLIKQREQKKLAAKKAEEARKNKKKDAGGKPGLRSNRNTGLKKTNNKINNNMIKTKSTTKKPLERKRGKSVTRLHTEKNNVSRNTIGVNNIRRKTIGGKKDSHATEPPRRNTISGSKKGLKPSRSMGKLLNKPTLKKISNNDNDNDNKKKEIEEMQKMVNNIKIQNKEEEK